MILGLTHLLLQVSDLEATARFYVEVLGFTERDRGTLRDGRPLITLRQGLGLTVFPAGARPGPRTVDHIAFRVEALPPFQDRLAAAGHAYEGPVTTAAYGTSIYVQDLDGNRIELHDR